MAIGTEPYTESQRYAQQEDMSARTNRQASQTATMRTVHEVESGTLAESLAGAGGVILAILGIIGLLPTILGAIAAISVGMGLFFGGGTIAARAKQLNLQLQRQGIQRQVLGGLGMEAFAGASGAVLGLLALLGISPVTLLSVSAIVLGGALLMASASTAQLERAFDRMEIDEHERTHEAVYVASGSDVMIGAGAIVLGILALAGHAPVMLALVAMLAVGAAGMLSGSAFAARVFTLFGT